MFELACGLKPWFSERNRFCPRSKTPLPSPRNAKRPTRYCRQCSAKYRHGGKEGKNRGAAAGGRAAYCRNGGQFLKQAIGDLHGVPCLVIGNGEMGRLAAKGLVSEGCRVNITLRQYKSGMPSSRPVARPLTMKTGTGSCMTPESSSAHRSPHHTLIYEQVKAQVGDGEKSCSTWRCP